jgi:hypothetical protein
MGGGGCMTRASARESHSSNAMNQVNRHAHGTAAAPTAAETFQMWPGHLVILGIAVDVLARDVSAALGNVVAWGSSNESETGAVSTVWLNSASGTMPLRRVSTTCSRSVTSTAGTLVTARCVSSYVRAQQCMFDKPYRRHMYAYS